MSTLLEDSEPKTRRKPHYIIWAGSILVTLINALVTWITYAPFLPLITEWLIILFLIASLLYPTRWIINICHKNNHKPHQTLAIIISLISTSILIPTLAYGHHEFPSQEHTNTWLMSCAFVFLLGNFPGLLFCDKASSYRVFTYGLFMFLVFNLTFNLFGKLENSINPQPGASKLFESKSERKSNDTSNTEHCQNSEQYILRYHSHSGYSSVIIKFDLNPSRGGIVETELSRRTKHKNQVGHSKKSLTKKQSDKLRELIHHSGFWQANGPYCSVSYSTLTGRCNQLNKQIDFFPTRSIRCLRRDKDFKLYLLTLEMVKLSELDLPKSYFGYYFVD